MGDIRNYVLALVFTLAPLSASAEVLFQSGVATPQAMTLEIWKALSADDKDLLLEGIDLENYTNLKLIELSQDNAVAQLPAGVAREFAEKMEAFMRDNSNLEVEDEHSRIGPVQVYWVSILMIDEQVLAGSVGFLQNGCDMEGDNWQYFETEDEAKAAGCDTGADVSWQAHAVFDFDGQPIKYDEYMEWSGY